MVRMVITNVIVGNPPLPSAIVLSPAADTGADPKVAIDHNLNAEDIIGSASMDVLPLSVGMVDAAQIARAADSETHRRPDTHDLLSSVITVLGGEVSSASITRVEDTTFFATVDVIAADGTIHHVDARPSDAIALALRCDKPILASEDVLSRAGLPNFEAIASDEKRREAEEFHAFVESLSPSDFESPREP